jgi:hypothetical protein
MVRLLSEGIEGQRFRHIDTDKVRIALVGPEKKARASESNHHGDGSVEAM